MAQAVVQLQDVVTTATGEQRRVELGNTVSTLGDVGKRVETSPITNMSDLLVAKAPGVNILPGMLSIYVWEGKRQRDAEAAMIIKTRSSLAGTVIAEARKLHPYANPAFVVLPVDGGSADFLR